MNWEHVVAYLVLLFVIYFSAGTVVSALSVVLDASNKQAELLESILGELEDISEHLKGPPEDLFYTPEPE